MPSPQEKFANALQALKRLQDQGRIAMRSAELSRTDREILLRNGFLKPVLKGWYIGSRPDDRPGDTTSWFSSYWGFLADYCHDRFGNAWCLSAEQSIQLHIGNRTVPRQIIVRTPKGGNKPIVLLHETGLFDFRGKVPAPQEMETKDRLNIYALPSALVTATEVFFSRNPTDARAALAAIPNAAALLTKLLAGGHSTIAGRLCGAMRNVGRDNIADEIKRAMQAAGYDVVECDPFVDHVAWEIPSAIISPPAARLKLMWQTMKASMGSFPISPRSTERPKDYLRHVEEVYVRDAYHSLSIEGYQVSPELIERVRHGDWHPSSNESDRQQRDALAARGYFLAFEVVKRSLERVLGGCDAGVVVRQDHVEWYRELFAPLVAAGLLSAGSLAGYRNGRVFITGSRHLPVAGDSVAELMDTFFELLENERDSVAGIVLGHFAFVYIHPYFDGNGRMGRFLLNLMLAAGGYPWTIVPVSQRHEYLDSLESASVKQDIAPFTRFIARLVQSAMNGEEVAM